MQPADHLGFAAHQRVFGNVETEGLEPWHDLHQVLDQESLGAADIEHAVAGLQVEVGDDVAGHGDPAPVVAISAIAVFAGSVEIHLAVLARDFDDLRILGLLALLDIAFCLGKRRKQVDFAHGKPVP